MQPELHLRWCSCQTKSAHNTLKLDPVSIILMCADINKNNNNNNTFTCMQEWSVESTHIVFGGIPSLLHIHHIHVQDRPELHLHKADQSAATLGTLQKELLIHENRIRSQEVQGEAKLLRTKASSPSWTRAHPWNERNIRLRRSFWALWETLIRQENEDFNGGFSSLRRGWTAAGRLWKWK